MEVQRCYGARAPKGVARNRGSPRIIGNGAVVTAKDSGRGRGLVSGLNKWQEGSRRVAMPSLLFGTIYPCSRYVHRVSNSAVIPGGAFVYLGNFVGVCTLQYRAV